MPKLEKARRLAEARKRMGMDTAARNNQAQRAIARWAALMCLGYRDDVALWGVSGQVIVSDVRLWCETRGIELEWEKPWTGSLFQCSWFEWTGSLRNAYHAGSNARSVREWRLTVEGLEAYWRTRG